MGIEDIATTISFKGGMERAWEDLRPWGVHKRDRRVWLRRPPLLRSHPKAAPAVKDRTGASPALSDLGRTSPWVAVTWLLATCGMPLHNHDRHRTRDMNRPGRMSRWP